MTAQKMSIRFEEFPPRPSLPAEVSLVIEAFASVVPRRFAVYLSAPITTGRRFVQASKRNGSRPLSARDHLRYVVRPNRASVRALANRLRKQYPIVIDPTATVDFPRWTQSDYRALWGAVIERYVKTVVFADGWQYSSGCAFEFLTAHTKGVRTVDERLHPLSIASGKRLLKAACTELANERIPCGFLRSVSEALNEVAQR